MKGFFHIHTLPGKEFIHINVCHIYFPPFVNKSRSSTWAHNFFKIGNMPCINLKWVTCPKGITIYGKCWSALVLMISNDACEFITPFASLLILVKISSVSLFAHPWENKFCYLCVVWHTTYELKTFCHFFMALQGKIFLHDFFLVTTITLHLYWKIIHAKFCGLINA
jgi:hypothetical protein